MGTLRQAALKQAARLGTTDLAEFAVGGRAPRRGFEFISRSKLRVRVRRTRNSSPETSLGFAGPAISVDSQANLLGTRLKITLDKKMLARVARSTIRVFRYEPSSEAWVLIPRSGVSPEADFAWAYLHRPGTYIPIGLPLDPQQLRQVCTLYSLRPALSVLREGKKPDRLVEHIFTEDVAGQLLAEWRGDPDLGQMFTFMDMPGPMPGLPEIPIPLPGGKPPRLPGGGLPEFQIIDDICPPWRGRRFPNLIPELPQLPFPVWPIFPVDWVSAGPTNFSGRIKSLAVQPTNGNIVYAGAANGGVWKTNNAGATWNATMFDELSMAIGGLVVSASQPNTIYAATGEDAPGWSPAYPGVGVYRSNDAGATWTLLAGGIGDRCSRLLVHPNNPDHVYVATNVGLFRSTTGGTAWTEVLDGHISDVVMDPFNPNILYAAIWNDGAAGQFQHPAQRGRD